MAGETVPKFSGTQDDEISSVDFVKRLHRAVFNMGVVTGGDPAKIKSFG